MATKVCPRFLKGDCRYKNNCNLEHVNLRQHIRCDIESAVDGNQWPISCYGPFKDKPCISNYIQDLSFEEMRCSYYEARAMNTLNEFRAYYKKKIDNAYIKIRTFKAVSPAVMINVKYLYELEIESDPVANGQNENVIDDPFNEVTESLTPSKFNKTGRIFRNPSAAAEHSKSIFQFGKCERTIKDETGPMDDYDSQSSYSTAVTMGNLFGNCHSFSHLHLAARAQSIFGQSEHGSTSSELSPTSSEYSENFNYSQMIESFQEMECSEFNIEAFETMSLATSSAETELPGENVSSLKELTDEERYWIEMGIFEIPIIPPYRTYF